MNFMVLFEVSVATDMSSVNGLIYSEPIAFTLRVMTGGKLRSLLTA